VNIGKSALQDEEFLCSMVVNDILGFIDLMGAIVANRYADKFRENPAFNIVKVLLFFWENLDVVRPKLSGTPNYLDCEDVLMKAVQL